MRATGGLKRCPTCAETKSTHEFNKNRREADGLQCECRPCTSKRKAEYYRTEYAVRKREKEQIRRHGLTNAEFAAKLASQGGACAICFTQDPGGKGWHLDHDHSCCPGPRSCVRCQRSILCGGCNPGLGQFRDDPVRLRAAADYLEFWTAHIYGGEA